MQSSLYPGNTLAISWSTNSRSQDRCSDYFAWSKPISFSCINYQSSSGRPSSGLGSRSTTTQGRLALLWLWHRASLPTTKFEGCLGSDLEASESYSSLRFSAKCFLRYLVADMTSSQSSSALGRSLISKALELGSRSLSRFTVTPWVNLLLKEYTESSRIISSSSLMSVTTTLGSLSSTSSIPYSSLKVVLRSRMTYSCLGLGQGGRAVCFGTGVRLSISIFVCILLIYRPRLLPTVFCLLRKVAGFVCIITSCTLLDSGDCRTYRALVYTLSNWIACLLTRCRALNLLPGTSGRTTGCLANPSSTTFIIQAFVAENQKLPMNSPSLNKETRLLSAEECSKMWAGKCFLRRTRMESSRGWAPESSTKLHTPFAIMKIQKTTPEGQLYSLDELSEQELRVEALRKYTLRELLLAPFEDKNQGAEIERLLAGPLGRHFRKSTLLCAVNQACKVELTLYDSAERQSFVSILYVPSEMNNRAELARLLQQLHQHFYVNEHESILFKKISLSLLNIQFTASDIVHKYQDIVSRAVKLLEQKNVKVVLWGKGVSASLILSMGGLGANIVDSPVEDLKAVAAKEGCCFGTFLTCNFACFACCIPYQDQASEGFRIEPFNIQVDKISKDKAFLFISASQDQRSVPEQVLAITERLPAKTQLYFFEGRSESARPLSIFRLAFRFIEKNWWRRV